MKASFLDVGGRVSMPIGLILCYSTKAPQSNLVIKSPKATRAGSSESSRTDLPNLQIPCSATVKGFARNTSPLGASCFNTWSKSFNWAIGMFREKEYRKSYQASIFNIRSFFPSFLPPFRTVSNHHLAEGHGERQEMGSWVKRAVGGP